MGTKGQHIPLRDEWAAQLRATYTGARGQRAFFARQFGVSMSTIGYWVERLGLTTPPQRSADLLTPERRAYLVLHYTGQPGQIRAIARALGVDASLVKSWVRRCKLAKSRQETLWTETERAYLRTHLPHSSYAEIAIQLGRSLQSVKDHASQMGVTKRDQGYTLLDLQLGFHCHPAKIKQWIERGWLVGKHRRTNRTAVQGGDFWHFSEQNVQRFLRRYPHAIKDLRFDYIWVHDLLVGGRTGVGELANPDEERAG